MTIFLSEHDAARLGIAGAKPRAKRGRNTRPDLPAAGRSAPTGLTTLIAGKVRTWSTEFCVGKGYRLYVIGRSDLDTGWHDSELDACLAAKAFI